MGIIIKLLYIDTCYDVSYSTSFSLMGTSSPRNLVVMKAQEKVDVIQPLNGDPFIGMLETPVTSAPVVANYLSNLPAYRVAVSPLLRGVEIGLAHGFFLPGPFIKLGPLRSVDGVAEVAGCMSAAGLVIILAVCLSIYGAASFQRKDSVSVKTLVEGTSLLMSSRLRRVGPTSHRVG